MSKLINMQTEKPIPTADRRLWANSKIAGSHNLDAATRLNVRMKIITP